MYPQEHSSGARAQRFREIFLPHDVAYLPATTSSGSSTVSRDDNDKTMSPQISAKEGITSPAAAIQVNAKWLNFFRKAKDRIRSPERMSKAANYDLKSVRSYPQWWKDTIHLSDVSVEDEGKPLPHNSSTTQGKDSISCHDMPSAKRCQELEASLSAQYDEETANTSARYYPALPIKRDKTTLSDLEAKSCKIPDKYDMPGKTCSRQVELNVETMGKKKYYKNTTSSCHRGTVKSTELSKRWEDISWPGVFEGSATADCLFVRSALIRKDLLFTFDPCLTDKSRASIIPHCGVCTSAADVLQYIEINAVKNSTPDAMWVLKPADSSNAFGIHFFRTSDAKDIADSVFLAECCSTSSIFVVQKYIEPLLLDVLNHRKFHIRTLMVCKGGPLKRLDIYKYKESRVLVATERWRPAELSNKCMHITNMSANSHLESYRGDEQNLSLISAFGDGKAQVIDTAITSIMKEIMQSIHCKAKKSQFMPLNGCYELFGLDFCVDSTERVWLLEVNPEPSMSLFPNATRDSILGSNPLEKLSDGWEEVWSSSLFDAVQRLRRQLK